MIEKISRFPLCIKRILYYILDLLPSLLKSSLYTKVQYPERDIFNQKIQLKKQIYYFK